MARRVVGIDWGDCSEMSWAGRVRRRTRKRGKVAEAGGRRGAIGDGRDDGGGDKIGTLSEEQRERSRACIEKKWAVAVCGSG